MHLDSRLTSKWTGSYRLPSVCRKILVELEISLYLWKGLNIHVLMIQTKGKKRGQIN